MVRSLMVPKGTFKYVDIFHLVEMNFPLMVMPYTVYPRQAKGISIDFAFLLRRIILFSNARFSTTVP